MKIRFIGTGSGKISQRYHTSILLDSGHKLLIDTGDAVSRALQLSNINYSEIDSILITHFHPDHISGFPMLLNQMKMLKREKNLNVYVFDKLIPQLRLLCEVNLIFLERLGFNLQLLPFRNNHSFEVHSFLVTPRENTHLEKLTKTKEIQFDHELLKCFSIHLESAYTSIHYTSDLGGVNDLLLYNDKSTDYLISECSHILPSELLNTIEMSRLKKVFLVHIDSDEELNLWYKNLNEVSRSKIVIATDGLEANIS